MADDNGNGTNPPPGEPPPLTAPDEDGWTDEAVAEALENIAFEADALAKIMRKREGKK